MRNPFFLKWEKDWTFQVVIAGGVVKIEGYGLGTCLSGRIKPGEDFILAADKLIYKENKRRKSMYNSWKRKLSTKS